jgi:1,4-alpha-glucan branching enzyme
LGDFDEDMVKLTKENQLFSQRMGDLRLMKAPEQTLAYERSGLLFAFNFHSTNSLSNVLVPVGRDTDYQVVLTTDDGKYGGWDRVAHTVYPAKQFDGQNYVELYLPARTGVVLKKL